MHHDLQGGKPLEVRWLSGGVVDLGAQVGVPTPMNRAVRDILALHADGRPSRRRALIGADMATGVPPPDSAPRHPRRRGRSADDLCARHEPRRVQQGAALLIDLETEEGVTGRSYLWCYVRETMPAIASVLAAVAEMVKGDPVAPLDLWRKLAQRFALMGVQGIVRMAMAGLDVAAWDAVAIAAGKPLATLARCRTEAGPGLQQLRARPDAVAGGWWRTRPRSCLAGGFRAVKLRLGYPTLQQDLATVRAVRAADRRQHVALMVDYNQALDVAEALARGRMLDGENIYWLEEPIRHDDYAGYARLKRELKTPIQIGENFSLPSSMEAALAADAASYVMPDLERIGGVTGWQRAAEACGRARHQDVVASVSGGQRASADRDADLPLSGICRLGRPHRVRAAADRGRPSDRAGPARQRPRLGQGGGRALPR